MNEQSPECDWRWWRRWLRSESKLTQTVEDKDADDGDFRLPAIVHQILPDPIQPAVADHQPHVARHSGQPQHGNGRHDVLPVPHEQPDDVGDVVDDEGNEEGGGEDCGWHVCWVAVEAAKDVGHGIQKPASLEQVDEAPDSKRPGGWGDLEFVLGRHISNAMNEKTCQQTKTVPVDAKRKGEILCINH